MSEFRQEILEKAAADNKADNKMANSTELRKTLSYKIRSSTDQITSTVKNLDHLLNDLKCCSAREKSEISTALSEALANAIIHGNRIKPDKIVSLQIDIFNNRIELRITDSGSGFDPKKIQNPTNPENILKNNGRGIYLMSIFMDDVKFVRLKQGMRVILTKYFHKKKN